MTASPVKIRRWPFAILGFVAAISVAYLFLPSLQAEINLQLRTRPPGTGNWLGTDALGRDLLAALAQGASRSMAISLGAGIAASLVGVLIGSVSAFYGDDRLGISWRGIAFGLLLAVVVLYLLLVVWPVSLLQGSWHAASFITAGLLGAIWLLHGMAAKTFTFRKRWRLPLDQLLQRFTEVFTVIPRLYLIVSFALIVPLNVFTLALLLTTTSWVGISRLVRAEMMRVRSMPYIEAARIMGLPEHRIYWKHALPNSLAPVATQVCFTMAGLLVTESTLSFVGIGVSPEVLSWGGIVHGYLENPGAWWLALFPGLVIYVVVVSFHAIGNDLDRRFHASS